jgi:hypothetical protein
MGTLINRFRNRGERFQILENAQPNGLTVEEFSRQSGLISGAAGAWLTRWTLEGLIRTEKAQTTNKRGRPVLRYIVDNDCFPWSEITNCNSRCELDGAIHKWKSARDGVPAEDY